MADLIVHQQCPVTALQISPSNGNHWNAEFLYRLLRVIADARIVTVLETNDDDHNQIDHPEETIRRFRLTEDGLLLTSGYFSKACDMVGIELNPKTEEFCAYLPSVMKDGYKNGNCFEQAFGCGIFDYMQKDENKEYTNLFNNAMITYSTQMIQSMVTLVDFIRFNKLLVDWGFRKESLLVWYSIRFRTCHCKCQEADAYTLKFIIHDWNDDKGTEILRAIRAAN